MWATPCHLLAINGSTHPSLWRTCILFVISRFSPIHLDADAVMLLTEQSYERIVNNYLRIEDFIGLSAIHSRASAASADNKQQSPIKLNYVQVR